MVHSVLLLPNLRHIGRVWFEKSVLKAYGPYMYYKYYMYYARENTGSCIAHMGPVIVTSR